VMRQVACMKVRNLTASVTSTDSPSGWRTDEISEFLNLPALRRVKGVQRTEQRPLLSSANLTRTL
jgi:hypothetical protein